MRRFLYRLAALMGWASAVSRGPGAIFARVLRVQAYKGLSSVLRGILK